MHSTCTTTFLFIFLISTPLVQSRPTAAPATPKPNDNQPPPSQTNESDELGSGNGSNADANAATPQDTDVDPQGSMCLTLRNDVDTLGTEVKALLDKAKEKLKLLPKPDARVDEDDLYIYKVVPNEQYKNVFERCKEYNLGVFSANSEEEVKFLMKFIVKKEDRKKDANDNLIEGPNDIFWLPLEGNEPDQLLHNAYGNYPYVSMLGPELSAKAKEGLLYTHPKPSGQAYAKCTAVERVASSLKVITRVCGNPAAVLCLKKKDFIGSWSARVGKEKQTVINEITNSVTGVDKIANYIKSTTNAKCQATEWTEAFSTFIRRHFPFTKETTEVSSMTLTSLMLKFPQLKQLLELLNKTSTIAKGKIGNMIEKLLLGPFVEITTSENGDTICICPKIRFLRNINDFLDKMDSLNSWYNLVQLDNQIRLPELIIAIVTTIALIVAIAGHCVQRRHVKLKEVRHQRRKEKRKREKQLKSMQRSAKSAQTSPRVRPPTLDIDIETPKSQKSVRFLQIFRRKKPKRHNSLSDDPSISSSVQLPSSPPSSPSSPSSSSESSSTSSSSSSATSPPVEKRRGGRMQTYA